MLRTDCGGCGQGEDSTRKPGGRLLQRPRGEARVAGTREEQWRCCWAGGGFWMHFGSRDNRICPRVPGGTTDKEESKVIPRFAPEQTGSTEKLYSKVGGL